MPGVRPHLRHDEDEILHAARGQALHGRHNDHNRPLLSRQPSARILGLAAGSLHVPRENTGPKAGLQSTWCVAWIGSRSGTCTHLNP